MGRVGYPKIGFAGFSKPNRQSWQGFSLFSHIASLSDESSLRHAPHWKLIKLAKNEETTMFHLKFSPLLPPFQKIRKPEFRVPDPSQGCFENTKQPTEWYSFVLYLLHIQEWKSNRFPKIITVFTSHFEMFVPFLFNQWVVLNGHGVPHKIFLGKNK